MVCLLVSCYQLPTQSESKMAPTKVNIDLQNERNKCTFNVEELTNFLDEGPQNTKYRRELGKVIFFKKLKWCS